MDLPLTLELRVGFLMKGIFFIFIKNNNDTEKVHTAVTEKAGPRHLQRREHVLQSTT